MLSTLAVGATRQSKLISNMDRRGLGGLGEGEGSHSQLDLKRLDPFLGESLKLKVWDQSQGTRWGVTVVWDKTQDSDSCQWPGVLARPGRWQVTSILSKSMMGPGCIAAARTDSTEATLWIVGWPCPTCTQAKRDLRRACPYSQGPFLCYGQDNLFTAAYVARLLGVANVVLVLHDSDVHLQTFGTRVQSSNEQCLL